MLPFVMIIYVSSIIQSDDDKISENDGTVGTVTAASFSGDGSGLTGVSASTDNIQTATVAQPKGVTTANNNIQIQSDDSTPGRLDFYCVTTTAVPVHANYSGNVTGFR